MKNHTLHLPMQMVFPPPLYLFWGSHYATQADLKFTTLQPPSAGIIGVC
jgi:hypothetical protein